MNKRQEKETVRKTTKKKAATKKATKSKITKKKTTAKKTAAKKKVVRKATPKSSSGKPVISPRERYEMIATMAYYRAEARNFEPGYDVQDWLDCENTIDEMLKKS